MQQERRSFSKRDYSNIINERSRTSTRLVLFAALTAFGAILGVVSVGWFQVCGWYMSVIIPAGGLTMVVMGIMGTAVSISDRIFLGSINPDSIDRTRIEEIESTPIVPEMVEGNTTRRGRYRFTDLQWGTIARALHDNDWRFTRKPLAQTRLFTNITERFASEIRPEFKRLGMIEENGNQWQVSTQGYQFLMQFIDSPSPAGIGHNSYQPTD